MGDQKNQKFFNQCTKWTKKYKSPVHYFQAPANHNKGDYDRLGGTFKHYYTNCARKKDNKTGEPIFPELQQRSVKSIISWANANFKFPLNSNAQAEERFFLPCKTFKNHKINDHSLVEGLQNYDSRCIIMKVQQFFFQLGRESGQSFYLQFN